METIKFIINKVAPLSTNRLSSYNRYGGNKNSNIKTKTINAINGQLVQNAESTSKFKRNFDKKNEVLTAYYKFYFPRHIFFTKKGDLNSKRVDVDNCIKLAQDTITKFIGIDDKYIIDVVAEVRPGNDFKWCVTYSKLHKELIL